MKSKFIIRQWKTEDGCSNLIGVWDIWDASCNPHEPLFGSGPRPRDKQEAEQMLRAIKIAFSFCRNEFNKKIDELFLMI